MPSAEQSRPHNPVPQNPDVCAKIQSYPSHIRDRVLSLRQLVIETAAKTEGIGQVEETLKWGEPSYVVKGGSPIRMAWKPATPNQYAMYFNCQTKLVSTFKALYPDEFNFEGNRAIIFDQNEVIAAESLKHCISLALSYHNIKYLPSLGA